MAPEQRNPDDSLRRSTRLLFMGEAALTEGFRLIGFETFPDATEEQLEGVLTDLLSSRERAFLVLDASLSQCCSLRLRQVRSEGGRILVAMVPRLHEPERFRGMIDDQVRVLLGGADLDEQR
jgi:vacuolar-type H+-ATPase subunit F/Vma7